MSYKYVDQGGLLLRVEDGAFFPKDEGCSAYVRYLEEVADDPACSVSAQAIADVDAAKTHAIQDLDDLAERVRLRYITAGAGQALTYADKAAEAKAFLDGGAIGLPEDFPFLSEESAAREITLEAAANLILTTRQAWVPLGAAIEGVRMRGKIVIAAQSTAAEVKSVLSGFMAELEAM